MAHPTDISDRISRGAQHGIVTLLAVMVLVVPLLYAPNLAAWRAVKPIIFEGMTLALVGLALVQVTVPGSGRRLRGFLLMGPNLPIVLLVLYGALSWARSAAPGISGAEWLRLPCGAGLY